MKKVKVLVDGVMIRIEDMSGKWITDCVDYEAAIDYMHDNDLEQDGPVIEDEDE